MKNFPDGVITPESRIRHARAAKNAAPSEIPLEWDNLMDDAEAGDVDAARAILFQAQRMGDRDTTQRIIDILTDLGATDSSADGRDAVRALASFASLTGELTRFSDAIALAFAGADEQDRGTEERAQWMKLIFELQASPLYPIAP